MTDTAILEIALQTMVVALKLSAPILMTSLVIGFTVSLFQSMTQIQEFTLAFVPKLIGVGVALLLSRQLDAAHADRLHGGPVRDAPPHAGLRADDADRRRANPCVAYLLASVRIVAWLAVVPPFSGAAVPVMAKVVLSLGLAFTVGPGWPARPSRSTRGAAPHRRHPGR